MRIVGDAVGQERRISGLLRRVNISYLFTLLPHQARRALGDVPAIREEVLPGTSSWGAEDDGQRHRRNHDRGRLFLRRRNRGQESGEVVLGRAGMPEGDGCTGIVFPWRR